MTAPTTDKPRIWGRANSVNVQKVMWCSHELGLTVVAEGVEDEASLELLRDMGCDVVQGYDVSRPLRAEAVTAFARQAHYPPPGEPLNVAVR